METVDKWFKNRLGKCVNKRYIASMTKDEVESIIIDIAGVGDIFDGAHSGFSWEEAVKIAEHFYNLALTLRSEK